MDFVLGICGYLGSGKSEVLRMLEKKDWHVIDADKVVHRLYEKGQPGQRKIVDFFGEEFLLKDGTVNRKKLGKIVFTDVKKLKILNALIHPLVFNEISKELSRIDGEKVAIEAVYFEDKYLKKLVDKVLVVERPKPEIKRFLLEEGRLGSKMIDNILNLNILPNEVDGKILNNSTLNDLEKKAIIQVEKLTS